MLKLHDVTVIAECACNHGGNIDTALQMIEVAAMCGADVVKFQKRDVESLPQAVKDRPRTDPHAFGATEYEHRKALEFTVEQHERLQNKCRSLGVEYNCSAWDQKSYDDLIGPLGLHWVKIPSAKNTECWGWKLKASVPLHVSLGMTNGDEREAILRRAFQQPEVIPYACTSKYPCRSDETYLVEVEYLRGRAQRAGFSGHHNGIALDIAAYVLGASYIERHFTLDRTSKGTDHAASLEPHGLTKLVRDLRAVREAYRPKPGGLPSCEEESRKKLKGTA